jgi:tyrosyl-tRNA synthetase
MMKKFMQIPDAMMRMYFNLLTNVPLEEVDSILAGHPKDAKIRLAKQVIAGYHLSDEAEKAADRWQREVGGGELPSDIPTIRLNLSELSTQLPQSQSDLSNSRLAAPQLLKVTGLTASTSDAMRLIAQGGLTIIDGDQSTTVADAKSVVGLKSGLLIKAGKKKIIRLEID